MSEDLTTDQLKRLAAQRRRNVVNRVASVVSVAEDLLTVLESPKLKDTVPQLLEALAGLVTMTDPNQSQQWGTIKRRDVNQTPSFEPAWADRKREQMDRVLQELAEGLNAWEHRPHDPTRPNECDRCGKRRSRDDLFCRLCGTPTLAAYRRCRVGDCPNRGKQRKGCPPHVHHPRHVISPDQEPQRSGPDRVDSL